MKKKVSQRCMTLVEMMIVMFLIAMITGVIAYNYTGSLEEGKAFKTKTGIERVRSILDIYLMQHPTEIGQVHSEWKQMIRNSPLVKNAEELSKDGWGVDYDVNTGEQGELVIRSQRYEQYLNERGKGSMFKS